MPDYRKMYYMLSREIAVTIERLQNIQKNMEEMYIETSNENFIVFPSDSFEDGDCNL